MVIHKAQDLAARPRTEDIQISEDIDFKSMLLPKPILKGLKKSGYVKPSPIQRKALPLVRCGLDLIVQAKAGTGKTCVFVVAALELLQPDLPLLQAVVLAPTREIALQITEVINALGQAMEGLKTHCFIGGVPIAVDQKNAVGCHIAVGAPGRMRYLMEKGILKPNHARLFVLDEADKLMEKTFVPDINEIFSYLPESKQVLAVSATYTQDMVEFLKNYMHQGQYVTPQKNNDTTVLIGIRQFISVLTHHVDKLARLRLKERHLLYLLRSITFNQCLIFSNLHTRAVSICNMLRKEGWAVEWIAGRQQQVDRVIALSHLKEQRVRILVTTDLTARGIDAENVNFIINLDVPRDHQTYLHRMGRAGRYGTHGLVITIISDEDEFVAFQKLLGAIGGSSQSVNCVPEDLKNVDLWSSTDDKFNHIFGIVENTKSLSEPLNQSQDITETDEKLSQESSDESVSNVINMCDKNVVPFNDFCSCNIYEAGQSDIKTVTGPSLFSVSKKDARWRDVLPVVVNEAQIPLNTPVALVDMKFIRIKTFSGRNKIDFENIEDPNNPILLDGSIVGIGNETNFLTYDEIKSILEDESTEQINLENKPCESYNFLSSQEIENFLENNVTSESESFSELSEVEKILMKYKFYREKLESILIGFDSFDVVGWMAVDKIHNIVDNIINDKLTVMEFRVVDCSSGKKHIDVVSLFSDYDNGAENFENHISTLNLNNLDLVQPFSLEGIVEKLNSSLNIQKTSKQLAQNKSCFSSFKTMQVHNTPYPEGNKVQNNGNKMKGKMKSNADKQNSNKTNAIAHNKNHHITSSAASFQVKTSTDLKESTNNYDTKKSHPNGIHSSTNGKHNEVRIVPKQIKKMPNNYESSEDTLYLLKENKQNPVSITNTTKNTAGDEVNDCITSNESSSDLSDESDTSSSEKCSKRSYANKSQKSSLSSEQSGNYFTRWQELHDCEESDSESSTQLYTLQPNSRVPKYLSDSTSSNVHSLHSVKNQRLHRQRRNSYRPFKLSSSNDTESDISNHNSFRTACSQHLNSGEINKEDVYIPPYSHCDLYGHSKNITSDQSHHHDFYNSSLAYARAQKHPSKRCQIAPKASTSKDFQCYDPYQYPDIHIRSESKRVGKNSSTKQTFKPRTPDQKPRHTPRQFCKRLTSNNLFFEWYSTWYKELRWRTSHLENIEYIKMMSAR